MTYFAPEVRSGASNCQYPWGVWHRGDAAARAQRRMPRARATQERPGTQARRSSQCFRVRGRSRGLARQLRNPRRRLTRPPARPSPPGPQVLLVIPSKERLDAWFKEQGGKYKALPPEERTECLRRLSHSTNAAAALFDSHVAAAFPDQVPPLLAALLANAPVEGGVSTAPTAEAGDSRARGAEARARLIAKRSSTQQKRSRTTATKRNAGDATQLAAGAALPAEPGDEQQTPKFRAPPRRRSVDKRRSGASR